MNRDEWSYYGWRAFHWLANQLPPWLGEPLIRWLAGAAFRFTGATRRNAMANMRHMLSPGASDAEVEAAARAAFQHAMVNYYLLFRPPPDEAKWAQMVSVDGREHVEAALALNHGLIVVSAHFGRMEIIAQYLRRTLGIAFSAPAEPIKPDSLFQLMISQREKYGGRALPADEGAMELARILRKRGAIAVTPDLDFTRTGLAMPLFDAPALIAQGPARLAMISRAPIVPFWTVRRPDGGYHIIIEPPILYTPSGDKEADIARLTTVITARLERLLARYPTQWMQFNPIWAWAEERAAET